MPAAGSGVMTVNQCGPDLDHAVVVVGLSAAENSWIVQNSWGDNWGTTLDGTRLELDQYTNCRELKKQFRLQQGFQDVFNKTQEGHKIHQALPRP